MKIQNILENISPQQRGVGQLPADFRPAHTSPQLNGPYPGRNATRGYLVGEDQDILEVTGDRPFDSMMRQIKKGTKKQAAADRRERDAASRERARAAFGPSPADKLSIRPDKGVAEADNTGPHIVYATGPRTQGINDVDLVFKDIRTGKIVARVVGNNRHLQEFAPPSGGDGGDGGDGRDLADRPPTYEIRMGDMNRITYVAFGDPEQDSEHTVYKLGPAKPGTPKYYGQGLTLVSELDWWSFLEKMIGQIMWEDDAIEAGYVDRLDNGDLVFTKQQGVAEGVDVFYNAGETANKKPVGKGTIVKNKVSGIVGKAYSWSVVKGVPYLYVKGDDDRYQSPVKDWLVVDEQNVAEGGYNPLADERREQSRMDQERAQFKRDELAAELGGEEQRARQIMSGTWYVVIDGQVWKRQGEPVTFPGREAARRAGQTIKNRTPERTVTITTRIPAAENSDLAEAPLDIDLIKRAQGGMAGTNQDPDSERFRDQPYGYRDRAQDRFDPMARLDKGSVNSIERALGIKWPKHRAWQGTVKVDESRDQHYLQMFREAVAAGMTSEDVLTTMKRQLGDYLQDVAKAIKKDPDLVNKIPKTGDQIGPAVRTIKTDDGHEIRIHGNEDDGFRISIRNRTIPSRFKSLDEAEIATEMYCARRRQATQLRDDYVDEA